MRLFLFPLLLLTSNFIFSQNVRFDGTVADPDKKPLEMANVVAQNTVTKAMDAFAITNDKGKFYLNLKANTSYVIKISYLGMAAKEISVTTSTENISQSITMEAGGIMLNDVEIVREMPVSISGDTIVYNADSFKSGTERKLEDILKKLPGVEVNADGEVEVEGKKVQKLMVEGKDFFDGDTKLGVKNIPADAIDKVQVLRNYNEISQLKGLENNEESVAMNIKLKEGKKNFWFGDMTAGIGVADDETRYLINPKAFYYSPKYSLNVITNFNNIGELPLTIQDYFKMTGGFRSMMKKGGTNFNVSSNDIGISLLRNNRAKEIQTDFGAANFSYNPTKSWSITGFGILSSSKTDLETNTQTEIVATDATENRQEKSKQLNRFGILKLSSSYKPSANFQLDYDFIGRSSKQDEDTGLLRQSMFNGVSATENISTDKRQSPVTINQNLSLYWTKSEKHVFAVEIQHLFQEEDPFYNANLATNPFPPFDDPNNPSDTPFDLGITAQPSGRYDINQDRLVRTNKVDAKVDYYYSFSPKSIFNITLGDTYSNQGFNSDLFQILDDSSKADLAPEANNDVDYSFNDVFLGFHYKFLIGEFTFNPGFSLHAYNMNNTQLGTEVKNNFGRFLPDMYAMWQIKKSETLTYTYTMTNDFTDINQLISGYVMSNFNSLFGGNRYLENATSQVHSLRYYRFNMFNMENIFANASYTKRVDAVKNYAQFFGVNQITTPFNSAFADESASLMGNYGRSFAKFYKASFQAAVNWSKFYNIQLGDYRTTESTTQNYTLRASTVFKSLPNLEVGYTLTVNDYTGRRFYTDMPFARLDYYFLDAFSFNADYQFSHYYDREGTQDNKYDFLNASLIYQKKGSKWEYKLSATNLLNTTSLNDNSFNELRVSTSQYYVQPRYIIFSLKYNI
ncbi:TonB-dependent receptor [Flavobacterium silvaticum]|uniref:TonB-dependent receptor n=1 Tax=Flavobacterium silvaticum TaxID=1852020 RepID=A0A972FTF3_9FLAO|nr:TonB-dependent receptor [Flavobacterium silvaticum]NMH27230.1 TonB-dependent receptor [Flavobacterium silvaticum]